MTSFAFQPGQLGQSQSFRDVNGALVEGRSVESAGAWGISASSQAVVLRAERNEFLSIEIVIELSPTGFSERGIPQPIPTCRCNQSSTECKSQNLDPNTSLTQSREITRAMKADGFNVMQERPQHAHMLGS